MPEIITRCEAFTGQGNQQHRIIVDEQNTVRVYDEVAGHYTTCHSLTADEQARLVEQASKIECCQACGAELHQGGNCPVCDPWEEDQWEDDF